MGYKGITQIVLILVGIIVAFSFTQPVLTNARGLQDDIAEYRNALEKASELNSRLQELVATRDSFDPTQLQALQRMLPAKIDQLAVMHEIEAIFAIRDMDIVSLTASDVVDPVGDDLLLEAATIEDIPESQGLSYQDFTIEFSGTYAQMRDLLVLFEASASLYEVMELDFGTDELVEVDNVDGVPEAQQIDPNEKTYTLILRTFALPAPSAPVSE